VTQTPNATDILARHAGTLDPGRLPAHVLGQAKMVLFDTVAVLLAASRQQAMNRALKAFPLDGGPCTVAGHGRGTAPERAAFLNGIGGHDTELDDTHSPSRTHAAAVIVPAALAAAEAAGGCTGATLLAGLVAGYDVQARVSKAIIPQRQFNRGFHPTATCGAIGSAVAAGRILSLSPAELTACLALAGSQSSGLRTYRGEPTHLHKSFQTGMAARNGLYAALLAQAGYPGAADPLTGRPDMLTPFGGPDPDLSQLTAALHDRYEICDTSIKRHACCGQAHSSIDAFLALRDEHGFTAGQIERIDVQLAHDAVPVIDNVPLWTHNLQHILATVALCGHFAREHVQPEWTESADVRQLANRVKLAGSDELQAAFPRQKGAIVKVVTGAGAFEAKCAAPRGNPADPLTEPELRYKFGVMAGQVLKPDQIEALWSMRQDFERRADLGEFFALLGGGR
jgi:2-methylcitrate dehydratase PrpD